MPNIFKSNFTLKFKNPYIEKGYEAMRNKTMRKYNLIYAIINLIISIAHSLIYALTFPEVKTDLYAFIKYTTYTLSGISMVWFIFSYTSKNFNLQKWISYLNIATIFMIFYAFRIYAGNVVKLDTVITTLIIVAHLTYLMAWFFTNSLDFFDGFLVYSIMCCVGWGYYSSVHPLSMQFRFFIVSLTLMLGSFVSYFYMKEKKKSFYFDFWNKSTIKSYVSIIQNMNSGFISIKNSGIMSLNKTIYTHLQKIDRNNGDNVIINENAMINVDGSTITKYGSYSVEKTKALLNGLFTGIVIESFVGRDADQTDYDATLDYVKNYNYDNPDHNENFIFIGTKAYKNDTDESANRYYEVFGRYCDRFKDEQDDNYEFMFNDVSKTKINEEIINAEMKYKSIFFSKVAHEFKNPLLCVSELIDQVSEDLNKISTASSNDSVSKSKIKDSLIQIKSMGEYLLMLVKDFDFFSVKSAGSTNKIKLEKQNIKLDRIISYCSNITNVLLKKFHKEGSIKFDIDCLKKLHNIEMFTDEVRVKQLLINLLSNSVKYTFHGQIKLQIQKENDDIVFSVIDTGKGLSDEQKMRLYTNSTDNREISAYSSSLGFSIIKELISLLDSKLYYESLGELGSKFSFGLRIVPNMAEVNISPLTHKSPNSRSLVSEAITVQKELYPVIEADVILKLNEEMKKNIPNDTTKSCEEHICSLISEANTDYYLVVDDETFTRKSTIRILNNYLNRRINHTRNRVILEASDGIECLYTFYLCMTKGIKLSFIISDQTMTFMSGDSCANILNRIIKTNNIRNIPYFIVTAYENFTHDKESVNKSYTKPLSLANIEEIFLLLTN